MNFKCIFFDFDGVIIKNSQIMFLEIMQEHMHKCGLNLQLPYYINNFLGLKGESIASNINLNYNFQVTSFDLKEIREKYKASLIQNLELDSSILELLQKVETCYICSSNNNQFINQVLIKANLKTYFPDENIFSLENTIKIKPDPMVYLNALKHSKLSHDKCCAIEDSITGVIAAKKSGLYTFGYVGSLPENLKYNYIKSLEAAGADKVINSFSEILI